MKRPVNAKFGRDKGALVTGFTRLDVTVSLAVMLLMSVWLTLPHIGERGRVARCSANLNALGKAMLRYANDHEGTLPPAGVNVGKYHSSWDLQILPYLKPGLMKKSSEQLAEIVPHFFACPSDVISHSGRTRSYAMGGNDMTLQNWPPGKDSATGVGMDWNERSVLALANEEWLKKPELLLGMKLSDIPVPGDTVLLTEFIASENILGSHQFTSVSGSARQTLGLPKGGAQFHQGKLNYLMADGHLECLAPLQTGSIEGTSGIWSLKKGN